MENIERVIITRRTNNYWEYKLTINGIEDVLPRAWGSYTGGSNGNYIYIVSWQGGILMNNVSYTVFSYYDATDNNNDLVTPASASELVEHFLAQGFFLDGRFANGGGGGGSSVNLIKQLLDVDLPTFIGRNGQVLYIDEASGTVKSKTLGGVTRFTELLDWLGNALQPNNYILTSSQVDQEGNALGLVQSPIANIVNRPNGFNETQFYQKGIDNLEAYANEPGDFAQGIFTVEGVPYYYKELIYNGGDVRDINSFTNVGAVLNLDTLAQSIGNLAITDLEDNPDAQYVVVADGEGRLWRVNKSDIGGGGNFIPLSGTIAEAPVTGDVEFEDYTKIYANSAVEEGIVSSLDFNDGNLLIKQEDTVNNITGQLYVTKDSAQFGTNSTNSPGIVGLSDFTAVAKTQDNAYLQTKGVKELIAASATNINTDDSLYYINGVLGINVKESNSEYFTYTNSNSFTVQYPIANLKYVFRNGVKLQSSDYTLTLPSTISISTTLKATDVINPVYQYLIN